MPTDPHTTTTSEQVTFAHNALYQVEQLSRALGRDGVVSLTQHLARIVEGEETEPLTKHEAALCSHALGMAVHILLASDMTKANHLHPGVPAGPSRLHPGDHP